jgi:hypothetical protein
MLKPYRHRGGVRSVRGSIMWCILLGLCIPVLSQPDPEIFRRYVVPIDPVLLEAVQVGIVTMTEEVNGVMTSLTFTLSGVKASGYFRRQGIKTIALNEVSSTAPSPLIPRLHTSLIY